MYKNKKFMLYRICLGLSLLALHFDSFTAAAKRKELSLSDSDSEESGCRTPEKPAFKEQKSKLVKVGRISLESPSKEMARAVEALQMGAQADKQKRKAEPCGGAVLEESAAAASSPKSPKISRLQKSPAELSSMNSFLMLSLFYVNGFLIPFDSFASIPQEPEQVSCASAVSCSSSAATGTSTFDLLVNSMQPFTYNFKILPQDQFESPAVSIKKNRIRFFKACCDCADRSENQKSALFLLCKEVALGLEELLLFSNLKDLSSPFERPQSPPSFTGRNSPDSESSCSSPQSSFGHISPEWEGRSSSPSVWTGRSSPDSDSSFSRRVKQGTPTYFVKALKPLIRTYYLCKPVGKTDQNIFSKKFETDFCNLLDCASELFFPSDMIAFYSNYLDNTVLLGGGFASKEDFLRLMRKYFDVPGLIFASEQPKKILEDSIFTIIMQKAITFKRIQAPMESAAAAETVEIELRSPEKKLTQRKAHSATNEETAAKVATTNIVSEFLKSPIIPFDILQTYLQKMNNYSLLASEDIQAQADSKGTLYELSVAPKLEFLLGEKITHFGQKIKATKNSPALDYDLCTNSFCIEAKNKAYLNGDITGDLVFFMRHQRVLATHETQKIATKKRSYVVVFGGNKPSDASVEILSVNKIDWIYLPAAQSFEDFSAAVKDLGAIAMSDGMRQKALGLRHLAEASSDVYMSDGQESMSAAQLETGEEEEKE